MLIFDGDYPAAHGTFFHSRDLTLPIDEVRANDNPEVVAMASLPEDAPRPRRRGPVQVDGAHAQRREYSARLPRR